MASSLKPGCLYHKSSSCNAGFSARDYFAPPPSPGHLSGSREVSGGWEEARDAAVNIRQGTGSPPQQRLPSASSGSGAETEKPCPQERQRDVLPTPTKVSNCRRPGATHARVKTLLLWSLTTNSSLSDRMVTELSVPFIRKL